MEDEIGSIRPGKRADFTVLGADPYDVPPETIRDIELPPGTTIGAIVRGETVLIAHDDVRVESDDHVILFLMDKRRVAAVERLFQVGLAFF